MDPNEEEDDDDAEDVLYERQLRRPERGTGRVFPTKFVPPSSTSTPETLFRGTATHSTWTRFVDHQDKQKILIFTNGACLNNGQPNPRAGWAFVHGPRTASDHGLDPARIVSGRLENKGP